MAEEVKKDEPKKKGPLGKLKEAVDDKEEQLLILSTFVRLGVMIWAGAILTLNYVKIPGYDAGEKIEIINEANSYTEEVRRIDASGKLITDPETADRNYDTSNDNHRYDTFWSTTSDDNEIFI